MEHDSNWLLRTADEYALNDDGVKVMCEIAKQYAEHMDAGSAEFDQDVYTKSEDTIVKLEDRIEKLESALADQNKITQMAAEILRAIPVLQQVRFPGDWEPKPHPLLNSKPVDDGSNTNQSFMEKL